MQWFGKRKVQHGGALAQLLATLMADDNPMLCWKVTLMVIAIIADNFRSMGNTAGAVAITKITFFILLALIVLALTFGGSIWTKATN